MTTFARGIRDDEGLRGFIPVYGSALVAVDLNRGAVLWRRPAAGRPIAATATRLVTLDREGPEFRLRTLDAADGRDLQKLPAPGMPAWADEAGTAADAVQVSAAETPEGLRIAWRVRRPYRGGAPPPTEVAQRGRLEATGVLLFDPASSTVRAADVADATAARTPSEDDEIGEREVSSDPAVLAVDRIGDRTFTLRTRREPGETGVTLQARDGTGAVIWNVVLAEEGAGPPRPIRR